MKKIRVISPSPLVLALALAMGAIPLLAGPACDELAQKKVEVDATYKTLVGKLAPEVITQAKHEFLSPYEQRCTQEKAQEAARGMTDAISVLDWAKWHVTSSTDGSLDKGGLSNINDAIRKGYLQNTREFSDIYNASKVIESCLRHGADIAAKDPQSKTVLVTLKEYFALLQKLLDLFPLANIPAKETRTAATELVETWKRIAKYLEHKGPTSYRAVT
jgi:hypothetical protein